MAQWGSRRGVSGSFLARAAVSELSDVACSCGSGYPVVGEVPASLQAQMTALGIETRPGFYPASAMPHLYGPQRLPMSDALAASILVLPSSPSLDDARIHRICDALATLVR